MKTRNTKFQQRESNSTRTIIASNFLLIIGTSIILAALIYMIVNLSKADSILTMWITFMVLGLSLMLCGLTIRLMTRSSSVRKIRNFELLRT